MTEETTDKTEPIETVDEAAKYMLAKARKEGMETTFDRHKKMEPRCRFGESGLCCRICLQGPCRLNPKKGITRGVCGAADYTITARNLIRMIAGGASAHSEHGLAITKVLLAACRGKAPAYSVKDRLKLDNIAKRIGIDPEGIEDDKLGEIVALKALNDFGKHDGSPALWTSSILSDKTISHFDLHNILPENLLGPVADVMHRTHVGVDADPVPIIFGGLECAVADLTGMHVATDLSDVLFGTPAVVRSVSNLGTIKEDWVNIAVHGHNPYLSEIVCDVAKEIEGEARAMGAKGINIVGICCTGGEVLMRRGIPLATNFSTQELAIMTGALDAIVVDVQCIAPSISVLSQCYHTKVISTAPQARLTRDIHIEFTKENAKENAETIVRLGLEAYKSRNSKRVDIPQITQEMVAGFSLETIQDILAKKSPENPMGYLKGKIESGEIAGIALFAGCNNVRTPHDRNSLEIAKTLSKNNILVVATGCAAGALAKGGFMCQESVEKYAGESLKKVLTELGEAADFGGPLPVALHMGSCVDNSRVHDLAMAIAKEFGEEIRDLPLVATAPEDMSEKAISIGSGTVVTGWPTHVGIIPYIEGSPLVMEVAQNTARDVYGGYFIFEEEPEKAAVQLVNIVKYRRWKLGLDKETVETGVNNWTGNTQPQKLSQEDLFRLAINGSISATGYADILLSRAIEKHGLGKEVGYPNTAYELPCFYGWSKTPVKILKDLPPLLGKVRAKLQEKPTLENAMIAGEATMWAAEIVEALKYIDNKDPYADTPYCGFVGDAVLRNLGISFVDDTIPGCMVFVGKANDPKELAKVIRTCQSKGMLIMASFDIIKQLEDENIKMGLDIMLYPLGEFTAVIHGLNFAIRAALTFGGVSRGDGEGLLKYLKMRPKVVVVQLGPIDQIKAAAEFAVMFNGSPTITDQDVEEIPGKYIVQKDYSQIVSTAIELREMQIKLGEVPVPVAYGPAFEGEVIRKPQTSIEFGGPSHKKTFELLKMRDAEAIDDGKIEVIGPEIDDIPEGGQLPLGIYVEAYGRKLQKDFESVLERRFHQFTNYAEGVWHNGQRNIVWIRISKDAREKGFKFRHIGEALYHKLHQEFGGIVNRIQVKIITDEAKVDEYYQEAMEAYAEREARVKTMTDEAVDVFYTCTLCQSFAPDHVCIVTPERSGLCGAINWLDAKASKEITPTGPNQPVEKGTVIDEKRGAWEGVNSVIHDASHRKLSGFNLYSLMEEPMTSCGCFECIVALVPEANGVMIVNREFIGTTPSGMGFSTLAGSVGGGVQTPGFIGVSRQYLISGKFISSDGGFQRIVWMPKELKEQMADDLKKRAEELGIPDFVDKIADETVTTDPMELAEWLAKVGHPAITMDPIF